MSFSTQSFILALLQSLHSATKADREEKGRVGVKERSAELKESNLKGGLGAKQEKEMGMKGMRSQEGNKDGGAGGRDEHRGEKKGARGEDGELVRTLLYSQQPLCFFHCHCVFGMLTCSGLQRLCVDVWVFVCVCLKCLTCSLMGTVFAGCLTVAQQGIVYFTAVLFLYNSLAPDRRGDSSTYSQTTYMKT